MGERSGAISGPLLRMRQAGSCTSWGQGRQGGCYVPIQQLENWRLAEVKYLLTQVSGRGLGRCPAHGYADPTAHSCPLPLSCLLELCCGWGQARETKCLLDLDTSESLVTLAEELQWEGDVEPDTRVL